MNPIIQSLPILILCPHARCNCRCIMCDIWKDTDKAEMSARQLEQHLAEIEQLRVQWVVFSGGEPLMHSDLFRFCAALRERNVRTTILSTGLLLERHAQRIAENIDEVILSLDGPPSVHDCIRRVPGTFEKLAAGVRALHERDRSFSISARCTIQKRNHFCVSETARIANQLGLRSISFLAADLVSDAFNRHPQWDTTKQELIALDEFEITVLEAQFEQLLDEWDGTGFVAENEEKLQRIVQHYRAHLGLCAPAAPNCNAPWVSAVVEANGTVRPCFFHHAVGTVNGLTLTQVLNGPEAVQFRRNLDVAINPVCQRCVCSLNWNDTRRLAANTTHSAFAPDAPRDPYYDSALDGWVLSRHADVLVALHETRFCPVDARAQDVPERVDLDAQRRFRTETLTALSRQQVNIWERRFADLACEMFTPLKRAHRVDVIKEFAEPWCLAIAVMITQSDKNDAQTLNNLARKVSLASADPLNEDLRPTAKAANLELSKRLEASPIPMSGPAFVALSQTLPKFLANAWLALLRHPLEFERLRGTPELMPTAVEELLRYAGLAHRVFRRASARVRLAGVTVERGARVILKLSSANRDPLQFRNPNVLDIGRRTGPQLALGTGPHSCAGGVLIRVLAAVATREFVQNVAALDGQSPVRWRGGSGFQWPEQLYVLIRQQS